MDGQIITSPRQARNLAQLLTQKIGEIRMLNDQLLAELHRLGLSFQDDGYQEIVNYHHNTEEQILEATAQIRILVDRLTQIEELLNQGKNYL